MTERTPSPERGLPLEQRLAELRRTDVPGDLADIVMNRVKHERRPLGLGSREWAVVGAAFGTFAVALQVMVSFATGLLTTL